MTNILVVEDEAITALDISDRLNELGFDVCGIVDTGQDAIDIALKLKPDVILMDIMLKGKMTGSQAAQEIVKKIDTAIIFLTAYSDDESFSDAKLSLPYGYITKPFVTRDLKIAVNLAIYKHKMERIANASSLRYKAIMENATCGIVELGDDSKILDMNKKAAQILGKPSDQCKGKPLTSFIAEIHRDKAIALLSEISEHTQNWIEPWCFMTEDGRLSDVELSCRAVNIDKINIKFCILNDLTELTKLRNEAILLDKLSTIGQLTAGIIHEINTPITYIKANIEYIHSKLSNPLTDYNDNTRNEIQAAINDTKEGADRISEIIRTYKGFAHVEKSEMISSSLKDIIMKTIDIAYPQYKHCAVINVEMPENEIYLICNPNKLSQAFLNIIINASQAFVNNDTTKNIIKISVKEIDNEYHISIEDNGVGIDKKTLPAIFNPFFTTKETGTGLGLSICYDIIKSLKGDIKVKSAVNKGTTFTVTLPANK